MGWKSCNYLRAFFAILAGWITTEVGRQPWTVHGLLRTRDAVSVVPGSNVAFTLLLFVITYSVLLVAFLIFVRYLLRRGPGNLPTSGGHGEGAKSLQPPPMMPGAQQ